MNVSTLVEQQGYRVITGLQRLQVALAANQAVMATDGQGTVYSVSKTGDSVVVEKALDREPGGSVCVIAPIKTENDTGKPAVIVNEHTLGILMGGEGEFKTVQVLHSSVMRGSPYTIQPGLITAKEGEYRAATKKDFDVYRVLWHPDYLVVDDE